jgi:rSAM/selenodomain-associated transferase 1
MTYNESTSEAPTDSPEYARALLVLFCKAPEAGRVKTRLFPVLSPEAAADLHTAFIADTLHLTDRLDVQRALACTPSVHHPFFVACARVRPSLRLIQQTGDDLGARMKNVLTWGFSEGFEKIVLIGCDSPTLPEGIIREAFRQLGPHPSLPCVLGPSGDGGYYLIGAYKSAPDLFEEIPWGSGRVMTETLRKLNARQWPCFLLPFWYDIDRPEDLRFLAEHLPLLARLGQPIPQETQKVMGRW